MSTVNRFSVQEKRGLADKQMLRGTKEADVDPPELQIQLLPATADDLGNQVKKIDRNLPIDVKVHRFPNWDTPDNALVKVQLEVNGSLVGAERSAYRPLPAAWFDAPWVLPSANTASEGEYELKVYYQVRTNKEWSLPVTYRVDITPPAANRTLTVPANLKELGLTPEWFEQAGVSYVELTYPVDYMGAKILDEVEFRMGTAPVLEGSYLIDTVILDTLAKPPQTQKLTEALAETLVGEEEAEWYFFVLVRDRKGNASTISQPFSVTGSMLPAPRDLAVVVEKHDDDGKLLLNDILGEPEARFNFLNFKTGDELRYRFYENAPIDVPIDSVPLNRKLAYGDIYNGTLQGTAKLYWSVKRKTSLYPKAGPALKDLVFDFRKPGLPVDPVNPPKPDDPDLNLHKPSAQGLGTKLPNRLTERDVAAGTFEVGFKVHEGHKKDDRAELHIDGVPVPEEDGGVITLDGTETDGDRLVFEIKSSVLTQVGHKIGARFSYVLTHPLNLNDAKSDFQLVDILLTKGVLPKPALADAEDVGDGPEIGCFQLKWNDELSAYAVKIDVPADERMANVPMDFFCYGFTNKKGPNGENIKGDPIPEAFALVQKTPTEAEAKAGFSFYVTHEVFGLIINGWMDLICRAKVEGRLTFSEANLFRIGMFDIGGDDVFCEMPPVNKTNPKTKP